MLPISLALRLQLPWHIPRTVPFVYVWGFLKSLGSLLSQTQLPYKPLCLESLLAALCWMSNFLEPNFPFTGTGRFLTSSHASGILQASSSLYTWPLRSSSSIGDPSFMQLRGFSSPPSLCLSVLPKSTLLLESTISPKDSGTKGFNPSNVGFQVKRKQHLCSLPWTLFSVGSPHLSVAHLLPHPCVSCAWADLSKASTCSSFSCMFTLLQTCC